MSSYFDFKPLSDAIESFASVVWGEFVLIPLLSFVGIYLTIGLRAMPWRYLLDAFRLLRRPAQNDADGEISPFQALSTALAATIGTGNIAGVATAIYLGGPGALFWMWIIALFGMATKYSEAVLALKYRQRDEHGQFVGGPMYYIQNGLGRRWRWLAQSFAVFGMIAAFGIGNMVQSNSVADVMASGFSLSPLATGFGMALVAAVVIVGGVRRIGEFAQRLVPGMALCYLLGALFILARHADALPQAFALILTSAFSGHAAEGGFIGASVWMALRWGFARGIFSNEAGLGSAAIAHAAAKSKEPVRQGMVAMLGTFIDTIVMCTLTGLVVITTGAWSSGTQGASMSSLAFETSLGSGGGAFVAIALAVFAFTTIIGWSYYGERCASYLFGNVVIPFYRMTWICAIVMGAIFKLSLVWVLADLFNGLMAIPNLIALVLLSPVVFIETRSYFRNRAYSAATGE